MKTFRLTFSIANGITGCVNNNTFFGLFCEAYKRLYGVDLLEDMLESLYNNEHTLAFSNPLESDSFKLANFILDEIPHARLDRLGLVNNELFVVEEKHIKSFDIICITDLEEFEEVITQFKDMHIGSRKNVGKGLIKDIKCVEVELPVLGKTSRLLSNIVPCSNLPVYGNFDYLTRKGYTTKGASQPTIVLMKAGSEFIDCKVNVVGCILKFRDSYMNGLGVVV